MSRLETRFEDLAQQGKTGFVAFLTAGYPDFDTCLGLLRALVQKGVDVLEVGMPFTDPMADGPAIQTSSLRALEAGQTMKRTLELVRLFRAEDETTPIVLMGYYNPVYQYGVENFLRDAKQSGVDGLIVVDLPPEEDDELCLPALDAGLNFIRLATPTTDDRRLPKVLENTSGFVYYVSIAGITGAESPESVQVAEAVARIKQHTPLPVAVGFGINTPQQARSIAKTADAVVVGSAIVRAVEDGLDDEGVLTPEGFEGVVSIVSEIAQGVHAPEGAAAGD